MKTHLERAKTLYGDSPSKPPATSRAPTRKSIYERPSASGATYDGALEGYYARRVAKLNWRNDREQVELARLERTQVEAFARKWKIAPADVAVVLDRLREHEELPRSKEALDARRPQTLESLRIELGSAEAAHKAMQAAVRVTSDLATAIPGLATRANETGAAEDGVLLKTLARYGEEPSQPPPAAA